MRGRAWLVGAASALASGAALAQPAAAAAEASPLDLEWNASPECPARAAVLVEVTRTLGSAQVVNRKVNARVDIERVGRDEASGVPGKYRGTLRIAADGGAHPRQLEADDCVAVTSAAALILALAVEGMLPAPSPPIEPRADLAPATPWRSRLVVSASALADTATLPAVALGPDLGVGWAVRGSALRLGVSAHGAFFPSRFGGVDDTGGRFDLLEGQLRGCAGYAWRPARDRPLPRPRRRPHVRERPRLVGVAHRLGELGIRAGGGARRVVALSLARRGGAASAPRSPSRGPPSCSTRRGGALPPPAPRCTGLRPSPRASESAFRYVFFDGSGFRSSLPLDQDARSSCAGGPRTSAPAGRGGDRCPASDVRRGVRVVVRLRLAQRAAAGGTGGHGRRRGAGRLHHRPPHPRRVRGALVAQRLALRHHPQRGARAPAHLAEPPPPRPARRGAGGSRSAGRQRARPARERARRQRRRGWWTGCSSRSTTTSARCSSSPSWKNVRRRRSESPSGSHSTPCTRGCVSPGKPSLPPPPVTAREPKEHPDERSEPRGRGVARSRA